MSTNIWHDPWVPGLGQHVLDRFLVQDEEFKWVRELINEQWEWRWECVQRLFLEDVVQRLRRIHLEARGGDDCWSWSGNPKGFVTVKLCYNREMELWWKEVDLVKNIVGCVRDIFGRDCGSCPLCQNTSLSYGGYFGSVLEWLNVEGEEWGQDQWASSLWDEFGCVEEFAAACNERQQEVRWEKPATPFCKLNTDYTKFSNEPVMLEAEAMKRGMELALEAGVKDLVIEGDAHKKFSSFGLLEFLELIIR
ncbi:uncharacterized protein G2W53_014307 [Senna tora]|uniref:Uncharacterized protein n=1 Tax=Senna tora TaxID=362788 RepID=A0A835C3Y3_9FABA|nr:uncharacterized protein G2W53_014307 [Senna tora]